MREFDLIRRFVAGNGRLPESVTIPPGDDMAGIRLGGRQMLIAVDQVIDQVHFKLADTPIEKVGRKAVTRNLSDVAAMAARPLATLVAAALPHGMDARLIDKLFDAINATADRYGCPVIGGDNAAHDGPLTLSVTILADPDGVEPVLRRGAQIGDAIYVTGQLGGSLHAYDGRVHHLDFEPRIEVARALASDPVTRPTAMIDLSDGLARDLPHLCRGAEIDAHVLPVTAVARQYAARDHRPGWLHAVANGEDYELLFTAPPDAKIPKQIASVRVTRIGRVVDRSGIVIIENGDCTPIDGLGWEHHA